MKLLLENKADINKKSDNGFTALIWGFLKLIVILILVLKLQLFHLASQWGHESIVKLLLENNADINIQCNNGFTALIWGNLKPSYLF